MQDIQLTFSLGKAIHGIHKGAVDGQSALASTSDEQPVRLLEFPRRDGKKFRTYRATCNNGLFSPALRRNFIARGNALRKFGEQLVRESGFGVGLEDDVWHTAKPRGEHHGPGRVAADTERRDRLVLPQNAPRV